MYNKCFDLETAQATVARMMCDVTTCTNCRKFFDIQDDTCPTDFATKEECVKFMQDFYVALRDKFEGTPEWADISFKDIEDILVN